MNLRNVLRTYALLRDMTDDESALLETLRALNDTERDLLVETLSPAKVVKKPTKKSATTREYDHCLRCGTTKRDSSHKDRTSPDYHEFQSSLGKSQRAVSLAEQIKSRKGGRSGIVLCGGLLVSKGTACNLPEGHALHTDRGYADYHPFQPPAPSVQPRSPRNSSSPAPENGTRNTVRSSTWENDELDQNALSSGVSSEDVTASAGDARSASGGD